MVGRARLWPMAVLAAVIANVVGACGGGGGSETTESPPNPIYVRGSGSDQNDGATAATALRSIARAASIALTNYTVIVGPGVYGGGITAARDGRMPSGLMFLADPTGEMTDDAPGAVVVDASAANPSAGFSISGAKDGIIDGFTIRGARDAGIVLKSGSDGFVVTNCRVQGNDGIGIRVQDSASVLVFNNLIYGNGRTGIVIGGTQRGSPDARIYSNTIADNNPLDLPNERGITVGTTDAASPRARVYNNIVQSNGGDVSIKVVAKPRSDIGYTANFNLVLLGNYSPASIRGSNDIHEYAQFRNAAEGDYALLPASPALDQNNLLPGLATGLSQQLREKTTTGLSLDGGSLDLGYHFPLNAR